MEAQQPIQGAAVGGGERHLGKASEGMPIEAQGIGPGCGLPVDGQGDLVVRKGVFDEQVGRALGNPPYGR